MVVAARARVSGQDEQYVREILRQQKDATLEDLARELRKHCGISMCKSGLSKTLKRMGISRKKNASR